MMSIRKMAQRILAPVIIILVIGLTIGMFYIGIPAISKVNYSYKGPAAKLNGETVKDADFNANLANASQQASQYAQYGMTFTEAQMRNQALSMSINNLVFKQEIKKAKVKVSKSDIDSFVKSRWPSKIEVESFMKQNNMRDRNELNKQVKSYLEYQKFVIKKSHDLKMTISKSEIEEQMNQIDVKHILVTFKDASGNTTRNDAEALKRANEVYQKAKAAGADFDKLAKEYSEDPGSKDKGGTIGPMPLAQFKTQMVKEFVDASLALKAGEISKPIKSQFGYHVIQLVSLGLPKGNEYKDKYSEIEGNLFMQKAQDETSPFGQWYRDLTTKAEEKAEILDPGLNAFRLKEAQKWDAAAIAYEKALKKKYYRNSVEMFNDASEVYLQLKKPKEALAVLQDAPVELQGVIEYQAALAKAYKEDNQAKKAEEILDDFGAKHVDVKTHEQLKAIYTDWKLTDKVAKEDQIIAQINKKEQEELKKYQEDLAKKQGQEPQTSPSTDAGASPAAKK